MFRTPVLDIYVTGACNLGCRYCFGELDSKPGMKRDILLKALDFGKAAGASAIEFCGGEPLLYKDFAWAVAVAKERGFKLILRTNALKLLRYRQLVASTFDSVGVSLDGDAASNDLMRPLKGAPVLSPAQRFEIPLSEIAALKAANPRIHIVLASVASKLNVDGIDRLAAILVRERAPVDLWKIYQFVSNNFRSVDNRDEFLLSNDDFDRLAIRLRNNVSRLFPVVCRTSSEIDGSCLVINRDGEVLVGSKRLGHLTTHSASSLCELLYTSGAGTSISENKSITYGAVLTQ
jgi:MoaA/NifB/PqqE/SkfB family radical SAM enzyme